MVDSGISPRVCWAGEPSSLDDHKFRRCVGQVAELFCLRSAGCWGPVPGYQQPNRFHPTVLGCPKRPVKTNWARREQALHGPHFHAAGGRWTAFIARRRVHRAAGWGVLALTNAQWYFDRALIDYEIPRRSRGNGWVVPGSSGGWSQCRHCGGLAGQGNAARGAPGTPSPDLRRASRAGYQRVVVVRPARPGQQTPGRWPTNSRLEAPSVIPGLSGSDLVDPQGSSADKIPSHLRHLVAVAERPPTSAGIGDASRADSSYRSDHDEDDIARRWIHPALPGCPARTTFGKVDTGRIGGSGLRDRRCCDPWPATPSIFTSIPLIYLVMTLDRHGW